MSSLRLFIAIWVPDEVLREAELIRMALTEFGVKAKFVSKENQHITLLFFGETPKSKLNELKSALAKVKQKSFTAVLSRLGVFPNWQYIRVIWLGFQAYGFSELHNAICRELGLTPLTNFTAHLTIARVKAILNKQITVKKIQQIKPANISFQVTKFSLVSSELTPEGPKYKVLQDYPLL